MWKLLGIWFIFLYIIFVIDQTFVKVKWFFDTKCSALHLLNINILIIFNYFKILHFAYISIKKIFNFLIFFYYKY